MTSWTWIGPETEAADWGDETNWYNETDHKSSDGTPQDGDDVILDDSAPITVGVSSLGTLDFTGHSLVTGNYSANVEDRGDLVSGTMDIHRGNSIEVDGATVTIDQGDSVEVNSGSATVKTLGGPSGVTGGRLRAHTTAYLDSYDFIEVDVTGGAFTTSTLTLQDESATRGLADSLFISGGSASVSHETELEGGDIFSAGGHVNLEGQLTISGANAQLILEGGKVQASDVEVSDSGATTSIDVHDKRSILTITGKLDLGHTGAGALSLQTGGRIEVEGDFVAAESGATATVTIGQDRTALTVHGGWTIGEAGTATASITAGGSAHVAGDVILGDKEGSTGALTVSGKDALLELTTGQLTVGGGAAGTLTVSDGGEVSATASAVTIGDEADGTGTVTVQGANSLLETNDLTVGGGGKATLSIDDHGAVQVGGDLALGDEAGGSGTVSLSNASLDATGGMTAGGGASGALSAEKSQLTVGGDLTLGEEKHGSGKMTLNAGQLQVTGAITLGEAGTGALTLNQGAVLAAAAGGHAADLTLGERSGATGSLTLDGRGTTATVKDVEVGVLGKGAISIKAGAALSANGIDIATAANPNQNSLSLANGAHLSVTTDVSVGEKGFGTLSLVAGAQAIVSGDISIGDDAAAIGSATITGVSGKTATELDFGGTLAVGDNGSGALTIGKGAHVAAVDGGAGAVEVAAAAGSTGKLTMTDAGSMLTEKSLAVGGSHEAAGGSATMTIGAGAQATFDDATVWSTGKLTLNGGTLHLDGRLEGSGVVSLGAGGVLQLGGEDSSVAVAFLSGSAGADFEMAKANLMGAAVKGFLNGDTITLDNLDSAATFKVKHAGAETTVTFTDHGVKAGVLTLAGDFTAAQLSLSDGVLTTTLAAADQPRSETHGGHAPAAFEHLADQGLTEHMHNAPVTDSFLV